MYVYATAHGSKRTTHIKDMTNECYRSINRNTAMVCTINVSTHFTDRAVSILKRTAICLGQRPTSTIPQC